MAGFLGGHGFRFLFRQDGGTIGKDVWWKGTALLTLLLATLLVGWLFIGGWAVRPANPTQMLIARTGFTYLYLFVFAGAVLLASICQYNLSAKRFRSIGQAPALAGLLPLAGFLTGSLHWLAGGIGAAMPVWGVWLADIALIAVVAWNVLVLGLRGGAR